MLTACSVGYSWAPLLFSIAAQCNKAGEHYNNLAECGAGVRDVTVLPTNVRGAESSDPAGLSVAVVWQVLGERDFYYGVFYC